MKLGGFTWWWDLHFSQVTFSEWLIEVSLEFRSETIILFKYSLRSFETIKRLVWWKENECMKLNKHCLKLLHHIPVLFDSSYSILFIARFHIKDWYATLIYTLKQALDWAKCKYFLNSSHHLWMFEMFDKNLNTEMNQRKNGPRWRMLFTISRSHSLLLIVYISNIEQTKNVTCFTVFTERILFNTYAIAQSVD